VQFGFGLAPSRCRALGLLYRDTLKKPTKLVADLSPLRGGRLWHRPEEYGRRSDVLACPCEEWGLVTPLDIVNTAIDVVSPVPGYSAIPPSQNALVQGWLGGAPAVGGPRQPWPRAHGAVQARLGKTPWGRTSRPALVGALWAEFAKAERERPVLWGWHPLGQSPQSLCESIHVKGHGSPHRSQGS
jgi:hypothetical protein